MLIRLFLNSGPLLLEYQSEHVPNLRGEQIWVEGTVYSVLNVRNVIRKYEKGKKHKEGFEQLAVEVFVSKY